MRYGAEEMKRMASKEVIRDSGVFVSASASRKSLNASQKSQEKRKKLKRKEKQERMARKLQDQEDVL